MLQLRDRLIVADLDIVELHVDNEDNLLSDVVEGNDLVKEHQVDVLERLAVLDLTSHARLAVAEVVIGEVADQTARKGRQLGKAGAFVVLLKGVNY